MKAYEREKLTENQKKLIEENISFCYYWMNIHNITEEDKQQELLTSVCEYIHLYDPDKGKITTFLTQVLDSKNKKFPLYNSRQKRALDKVNVSLEEVIIHNSNPDENVTLKDIIKCEDRGFELIETKDYYRGLLTYIKNIGCISPLKFNILLDYMNIGNMKKVAETYGCTHQNISRICNEVKLKLKRWKKVYDEIYY